jgi:phosphopantetheine adenylyltransferase
MKSEYEAKIDKLSNRADTIRNSLMNIDKKRENYESIADVVDSVIKNNTINTEIIDLLVDKIEVNPDKSFEVFFRYDNEFGGICA